MRIPVALCTVLAVLIAAPWTALGQGYPPAQSPSQPAPSQPSPSSSGGTTIEGVVANVDATCGGKPATGCQIVEIAVGPATSAPGGTSAAPSAPSGTSATPAQTTKIMIPKDAKITSSQATQDSKPIQLAKGDKVKITYEKKQDGNVATSVTLVQKAGQ